MAVKDRWEDFGVWLATERAKAEVSQKLVAIKAAVSPIQLNRIEKGNSGVKRDTLINIIEAVNDHSTSGYKVDINEALNRAGFAYDRVSHGKPQTVGEFVKRLEEMGFDFYGFDEDDLESLGPNDLQDMLDRIEAELLIKTRRKKVA